MVCLPIVKKTEDMFIRFDRIHESDGRTGGRSRQTPHDSIGRACIASCGINTTIKVSLI